MEKRPWGPPTESHKEAANTINIKVYMTYISDDHAKSIPPTHPNNNAIIDSGTTGHFPQDTSVWMN